MSLKKGLLLFLLVGFFATFMYVDPNLTKKETSRFINTSVFSSKGVVARTIQVHLNADSAESDNESVEVVATVSVPFDINEPLNYRWKLGEGVTLQQGELTGTVKQLLQNNPTTFKINVYGFSKQNNHQIGFEILGLKNRKKLIGDALIASDFENTFENIVQSVEKIKAEK
jgi:hypothetical protein